MLNDCCSSRPTVALARATRSDAAEISDEDVDTLVTEAISNAGGLDFISDGQTVVLKPNLVNTETTGGVPLQPTVNGVTTDFRVTRAVARLVRAKNPAGKVLVMEGSTVDTTQAFLVLGYTKENFGALVDEFIPLEGTSCQNRSTDGLIQKPSIGGKLFWANERYATADIVISIGVLKTHMRAGITGSVKNLGVGATPASQYSNSECSRGQTPEYIDHQPPGLATFVHDYYSIREADFGIIDGLQGIQNGPNPLWVDGADYESDKMNMRLILAGRDAIAVDTVEALVMGCEPRSVAYLSMLESNGFGVANPNKIRVVGGSLDDVRREFKGPEWACGSP